MYISCKGRVWIHVFRASVKWVESGALRLAHDEENMG